MVNVAQFDQQFKSRLYEEIKEIEKETLAEVVVIIRGRSDTYRDVALWSGFVLQLVVLAYLLFSPREFNPYWICFAGVISFIFGYLIVQLLRPLKRFLAGKRRMSRQVEIYARAIFQKGRIYNTRQQTGLLIFVSLFERMVYLVPDLGLLTRIPEHVLEKLRQDFNDIFIEENLITEALLSKLGDLRQVLNQYVPPVEDDINEIPDDLEVEL